MNGTDQAMSSLWYLLALVLVGSALIGRRLPLGGLMRMALLWIVIFGVLLGLFTMAQKAGLVPARFQSGALSTTSTPPSAWVEEQALHIGARTGMLKMVKWC